MDYIKKICLIKEYSAGFSIEGQKISGMAICELSFNRVTIEISISNLAPLKDDNYVVFIGNSAKNTVFTLNNGYGKFVTTSDILSLEQDFAILVLLENPSKIIAFGKTLSYPYSAEKFFECYKEKSLTLFLEEEATEREIEEALKYSDDVVATENYFEKEDVDFKNLSLKEKDEKSENEFFSGENKLQKEAEKNTDDSAKNESYCEPCKEGDLNSSPDSDCPSLEEFAQAITEQGETLSVCEDVENLLNYYPRFAELENAIYNSKWVTVPLDGCEYYFGRANISSDVYLCYAVRGERDCCPKELENLATFIPSPYSKTSGFYVMFQKEN